MHINKICPHTYRTFNCSRLHVAKCSRPRRATCSPRTSIYLFNAFKTITTMRLCSSIFYLLKIVCKPDDANMPRSFLYINISGTTKAYCAFAQPKTERRKKKQKLNSFISFLFSFAHLHLWPVRVCVAQFYVNAQNFRINFVFYCLAEFWFCVCARQSRRRKSEIYSNSFAAHGAFAIVCRGDTCALLGLFGFNSANRV